MAKNIHNEYEKDFYAWAIHNAKLLRAGKFSEIDVQITKMLVISL